MRGETSEAILLKKENEILQREIISTRDDVSIA
jgi:hypothetical protein